MATKMSWGDCPGSSLAQYLLQQFSTLDCPLGILFFAVLSLARKIRVMDLDSRPTSRNLPIWPLVGGRTLSSSLCLCLPA